MRLSDRQTPRELGSSLNIQNMCHIDFIGYKYIQKKTCTSHRVRMSHGHSKVCPSLPTVLHLDQLKIPKGLQKQSLLGYISVFELWWQRWMTIGRASQSQDRAQLLHQMKLYKSPLVHSLLIVLMNRSFKSKEALGDNSSHPGTHSFRNLGQNLSGFISWHWVEKYELQTSKLLHSAVLCRCWIDAMIWESLKCIAINVL